MPCLPQVKKVIVLGINIFTYCNVYIDSRSDHTLPLWFYYKSLNVFKKLRILTFHWECPASAVIQTGIWKNTEHNEPNITIKLSSKLLTKTLLRHIIIWNDKCCLQNKNKHYFAFECLKTHELHRQRPQQQLKCLPRH